MKKIILIFIIILFCSVSDNSQDNSYWLSAKPGTTKVFTVTFNDGFRGVAISSKNDTLISEDGGTHWRLNSYQSESSAETNEEYFWKADIYCVVMRTTDSGLTWFPYDGEWQEQFCGVYLSDNNTRYKVASEFLNEVTTKIFLCLKSNEVRMLINNPQQCTEYYRNPDEGWALGWCTKDIKTMHKDEESLIK